MQTHNRIAVLALLGAAWIVTACAGTPTTGPAPATATPASASAASPPPARKLPHKAGTPVAVAIYEFRSGVMEVPARASTDLFITALVQNGTFHVVERAQLNQGVVAEKQLNSQGLTTGQVARKQLRGAEYIFEGAISEANAAEQQRAGSVGVAGMEVSRGATTDVIAVDVRIVDATTGDVLDAVTVRKSIKSKSAGVSGVGSFLGSILARKGADPTFAPDASVQTQRKESIDAALRAVLTDAVTQLAARF